MLSIFKARDFKDVPQVGFPADLYYCADLSGYKKMYVSVWCVYVGVCVEWVISIGWGICKLMCKCEYQLIKYSSLCIFTIKMQVPHSTHITQTYIHSMFVEMPEKVKWWNTNKTMIVHYEIIDKPGDPKAKKSLIIFPNIYHSHQEMSFQPLNSTHLRTLRVGYSQPDLHIYVPHSTHLHVLTISSTFPTEHGRVNGDFYWSESRKPSFTPVIRPCWTKTSSTPIITPSAIHHS